MNEAKRLCTFFQTSVLAKLMNSRESTRQFDTIELSLHICARQSPSRCNSICAGLQSRNPICNIWLESGIPDPASFCLTPLCKICLHSLHMCLGYVKRSAFPTCSKDVSSVPSGHERIQSPDPVVSPNEHRTLQEHTVARDRGDRCQ